MKILFILLIGILFSVEIYAQEQNVVDKPVPVVVFRKAINQNDGFLMIKTDSKIYFDSLGGDTMLRSLLPKKIRPNGYVDVSSVQEWWAWLIDRALPEEVKQLFDLSPRRHGDSFGSMYANLWSYENVQDELQVELWFNDDLEIIQIKLEFVNPDVFMSISDKQLKLLCDRMVECQASAKEVFRFLTSLEGRGQEHYVKKYRSHVFVNGALKWGEVCRTKEPDRWNSIVERFEQMITVPNSERKSKE